MTLEEMTQRYLAGESENSLAKDAGVSRRIVHKRLVRAGVEMRLPRRLSGVCQRGHEQTEENTYPLTSIVRGVAYQYRGCRLCRLEHQRNHRARPTRLTEALQDRVFANARREDTGCLIWTGRINRYKRPVMTVQGTPTDPGRVLWERDNGSLPSDRELHHRCENPLCVEPSHRESLTTAQHRQVHGARRRAVAPMPLHRYFGLYREEVYAS